MGTYKLERSTRALLVFASALALGHAPDSAEAKWKYRVTPHVKNSNLYYVTEIPNTEQLRSQFDAELNAVYRWEKNFKIVLQPVGSWDPTAKRPTHTSIAQTEKALKNDERYFYDLREGYVQLRARPFTIT